MEERLFNLVDEPWIRVEMPDCSVREVSLKDALVNAHHYKGLAGEMETQDVAVLRLLIAVTHTVFTRVDAEGNESPAEDEKTAMNRWRELQKQGCLQKEPVEAYLRQWHDRFWLFDPERPFYQALSARNGTECGAAKLNGAVSQSGNKERLFSSIAHEGKTGMTLAEGARWLLFINGFDDCAAKQKDKSDGSRSMPIAWLGKLGLVSAVGDDLFESILMNMPMMSPEGNLWKEDDLPVWELPQACQMERRTITMPVDLAGLFTLQSRRVMLFRDGEVVTGYGILGGDAFSEQNALNEPMTLWKRVEDKKNQQFWAPKRHERARQIWRDFGSLVTINKDDKCPGVVSWCKELQRSGMISSRRLLTFRTACVRYDSSQFSSITDSFSDTLSFHANLLEDAGKIWIREINAQVKHIEDAADQIGQLAVHLGKASGQREDDLKEAARAAKEQYYLEVDLPFRDWLLELDNDQESDERIQLTEKWQQSARQIAMNLGRQLVDEKGDVAYVGRMVEDKKKKTKYHYSSPEAYRWFRFHLDEIYPYIKKG